jgi:apolipoprotein N-acyltransferase
LQRAAIGCDREGKRLSVGQPQLTVAASGASGSIAANDTVAAAVPSPWFLSLSGLALYWFALPPVGWWPLAWLVLAPWTVLVLRLQQSPPRRWWMNLWLSGTLFWLAMLYWIPLPHPLMWIAWPLLSGYCALYFVAFTWISRRLVHIARWPALWALPLTWAVLEWVRAWMITGFSMANLGHSQYRVPVVIQLASLGGDYSVSWFLAFVGVALGLICFDQFQWRRVAVLVLAFVLIAGNLIWGSNRLAKDNTGRWPALTGFLIQGSIDTEFPATREESLELLRRQFAEYRNLSIRAVGKKSSFQTNNMLLIWPETSFLQLVPVDSSGNPRGKDDPDESVRIAAEDIELMWRQVTGNLSIPGDRASPYSFATPLLTGVAAADSQSGRQYNSAVLIVDGKVESIYHKNHRVIFGEYVPLAEYFPFLDVGPNGKSLAAGRVAGCIEWQQIILMPEICFETTVPHLVRRHWLELDSSGKTPDAIVCLTNDGWFFGSSCLDLHLACNVFRAVETLTPVYVAANTGLSAEIDAYGQLMQVGPRRQEAILEVSLDKRPNETTTYIGLGGQLWRSMALIVLFGLLIPFFGQARRGPKARGAAAANSEPDEFLRD